LILTLMARARLAKPVFLLFAVTGFAPMVLFIYPRAMQQFPASWTVIRAVASLYFIVSGFMIATLQQVQTAQLTFMALSLSSGLGVPEGVRPTLRQLYPMLVTLLVAVSNGVVSTVGEPPWATRVMAGQFNLAIADIRLVSSTGDVTRGPQGRAISSILYDRMEEKLSSLTLPYGLELSGPVQTGSVNGETRVDREKSAEELASAINATVLVYGLLVDQGAHYDLLLEFYVRSSSFHQAAEITGYHELGTPIRLEKPLNLTDYIGVAEPSFVARVDGLVDIALGLAFLSADDMDRSLFYLERAVGIEGWGEHAGKEVAYVLLGNAYGRLSSIEGSSEYLAPALKAFDTALRIHPDFERAQLGKAGILYMQAIGGSEKLAAEPAGPVSLEMLLKAGEVYKSLVGSRSSPASADIPNKARFGLGQVFLVLGIIDGVEWLSSAEEMFDLVVEDYTSGNTRISELAGHAYARLARIELTLHRLPPDQVAQLYATGASLVSPYWRVYYLAQQADILGSAGELNDACAAYHMAFQVAETYGMTNEFDQYVNLWTQLNCDSIDEGSQVPVPSDG
jgi:tetratricopeptide (TPR) repeat protein